MLLNACLFYGFMLAGMLNGHIKPWVNENFGDTWALEKYREVMSYTDMYTLLEYCILSIVERKVSLSKCQFGYRANTSTSLATLVLKEVLYKYVRN